LRQAPLDLPLLGAHALLGLARLCAPLLEILLELGPDSDGLFLGLEVGLAAQRVGLAPRLLDQQLARPADPGDPGSCEEPYEDQRGRPTGNKADENPDHDRHARAPPSVAYGA